MVTNRAHIESSDPLLARLAELYGVQTRYRDALGREREPSRESLLQTLLALGAEVNGLWDLASAVRAREAELWATMIDPVAVAWEGRLPELALRLPADVGSRSATAVRLTLTLEDGSNLEGELPGHRLRSVAKAEVDGRSVVVLALSREQMKRTLQGAGVLPPGYHRLQVEADGLVSVALVISAPRRCWEPEVCGDDVRDEYPNEMGRRDGR
jgi:4-alpha-glucanotransferase